MTRQIGKNLIDKDEEPLTGCTQNQSSSSTLGVRPMANAALQNMGTLLRYTHAEIQRIVARKPGEQEGIDAMQESADAVVVALDNLKAGAAPADERDEVSPSPQFLSLSKNVTASAITRLGRVTEVDVPGLFDEFQELAARLRELDQALALAQGRRP